MLKMTEETINPFVRCVGCGTGLYQKAQYCAYDYRLIYFAEGVGEMICNGEIFPAEAGDLYIFAPETQFAVHSSRTQTCIVVNFDWTQNHSKISSPVLSVEADDFSADRIIEKVDLTDLFGSSDAVRIKRLFEAEEILRSMNKVYYARVKPNAVLISGLMKQLIGIMTDRLRRIQGANEKALLLAGRIISYVQESYAQRLTLEDAAEHFHYHPTYINRVMKNAVGVSFHQYLIDYRLKQSLQLLELNNLTMEEIAARVGFANSKHFSACFRKHFQIAPSRYGMCQI